MYYTTMADLDIRQKMYSEAIDPLTKAIDLVSGKISRYRLNISTCPDIRKGG